MPAPQRSDRTPPRAPARPEQTSDSAPRRDLASGVPLAAYEASFGDTAERLATAREDRELVRQLMTMPAQERIEAALGDARFRRPTLARMLALEAESALGDPARDPRPIAELGAAIAGSLPRDPAGTAQRAAAWAYWLLGKALLRAAQWRLAETAFQSISAFIPRGIKVSEGAAFACLGLAQLHEDLGHEQQAAALFLRAAYLYSTRGDRAQEAACQAQLGLLLHRTGDLESALRPLRAALRLFDPAFAPSLAARLRLVLAGIETVLGHAAAARKQLRLTRKLYPLAPSPAEAIERRWSKARIAAAAGENEMAEALFERVRRELLDHGSLAEAALCSCEQLMIQIESRRFAAADPACHGPDSGISAGGRALGAGAGGLGTPGGREAGSVLPGKLRAQAAPASPRDHRSRPAGVARAGAHARRPFVLRLRRAGGPDRCSRRPVVAKARCART